MKEYKKDGQNNGREGPRGKQENKNDTRVYSDSFASINKICEMRTVGWK
jgi:hypothetical protein